MQKNRGWLFKAFRNKNLKFYNSKINSPAYLDLNEHFPDHVILKQNWKEIKKEIEEVIRSGKKLPKFHEVDDGQDYISNNDGSSWSLLNLLLYDMWHKKKHENVP